MERFDGEQVEVYDDNLVFLDDLSGQISCCIDLIVLI